MTTPSINCRKLTIFEGPDGGGKSTAAQKFAEQTGAHYVHFGPLPGVTKGLGRMYVEAMMPALMGYTDVVFDRSWLSELPYGVAFRLGANRLGVPGRRMLERLAMRCETIVVNCRPAWDVVRANYLSRKHIEMLEDDQQLRQVYDIYGMQESDLPSVVYDYTKNQDFFDFFYGRECDELRTSAHVVVSKTAGNLDAKAIIVGERFADQKDNDALYQWPFGSFSGAGCSRWLAEQLDGADIHEKDLLWVNADQPLSWINSYTYAGTKVFALGNEATKALNMAAVPHEFVQHPQAWKRFRHNDPYPLIDMLRSAI